MKDVNFGKRLRNYREKSGLTVKQVSQNIGVSQSTYREWEYGRSVTGNPYISLSQIFNICLEELMTGEPSKKNEILRDIEKIETMLCELKFKLYLSKLGE